MELKRVTAKNFCSFKELDYEFKNNIPTLIIGENLTDGDQESNGSGKSRLVSAIEYCILHSTSQNTTDKALIFWWDGSEQADVSLEIFCPKRKQTLFIERSISLKLGGQSQLSINGTIKYAFADKMVNEIDKFIIDWIGISKEDLQNFFILSKFKYTSFFKETNSNLVKLIGRFSNSSIIAGIDKDILVDVDAKEALRSSLVTRKDRLYGMIEAHQQNIQKELTVDKQKLVDDELDRIDDMIIKQGDLEVELRSQISIENDKIQKSNDYMREVNGKLASVTEQLKSLAKNDSFESRFKELDEKMSGVKKLKSDLELQELDIKKNYNEVFSTLDEINRNIKGSVKCPNCSFEFVVGREDVDIKAEKEALKDAQVLLAMLDKSLKDTKETIDGFKPKITEIRNNRLAVEAEETELQTLKRGLNSTINVIDIEKGKISTSIEASEHKIKSLREQIDQIQKYCKTLLDSKSTVTVDQFDNTERIKAINEEISKCNDEISSIEAEDRELADQIFEIKTWAYTFKEFVQYLSVKTLKVLQGYANDFLNKLGSDLRVSLEGFKIKSDSTLSDKITVYVIRDGEQKEFGNFSGGEKARLEMGMILTVQNAINSTNAFGGLNFLSIDEILESADFRGLSVIIKNLQSMSKTVMLTTHVPVSAPDCETLKIVKVNKVSMIYND
jgi:exonuclease SbcC